MNKILLYAEEDPTAVLVVRQALLAGNLPFDLHVARGNAAALSYLTGAGIYSDREAFPLPDVMLSNFTPAEKNPFKLVEWVRSQKQFRKLFFMMHSNSLKAGDAKEAVEAGANACFRKTVDCHRILEILQAKVEALAVRAACAKRDLAIRSNA